MINAKWKIIITFIYIIILFLIKSWIAYGIMFSILLVVCFISKMSFHDLVKFLKKMLPIIIFTAIINMFFIEGATVFSWAFIKISREGIEYAVKMVIRIICLILGSSILTYTTTPLELASRYRKFNETIK